MAQRSRKFWGCYKKAGQEARFTFSITAPDVGTALDMMYAKVDRNAKEHMDDEYDLMEIVGDNENQYVPVAQKFKGTGPAAVKPAIKQETVEKAVFTEKSYVSWRDAA